MSCETVNGLIDRYINGELSPQEERELRAHAAACADCAQKFREAKYLKELLGGMDDGIVAPLEAQAAWRKAVKAEAGRKIVRRRVRFVSYAAAALVLVIGCGLFLKNGSDTANKPAPIALQAAGLIERDGVSAESAEVDDNSYSAWKKIRTADTEAAAQTLSALADEYGGTVEQQEQGVYRVELSSQYLDEFLQASSRIGEELDSEAGDNAAERAIIYIQFIAE